MVSQRDKKAINQLKEEIEYFENLSEISSTGDKEQYKKIVNEYKIQLQSLESKIEKHIRDPSCLSLAKNPLETLGLVECRKPAHFLANRLQTHLAQSVCGDDRADARAVLRQTFSYQSKDHNRHISDQAMLACMPAGCCSGSIQQQSAASSLQPADCSLQLQQNVLLQAGCRLQSVG